MMLVPSTRMSRARAQQSDQGLQEHRLAGTRGAQQHADPASGMSIVTSSQIRCEPKDLVSPSV